MDAAANVGPMTEAGRAIQSLVVTEAVRDATIGGRKVKRGQTIALDPDDGLIAVERRPREGRARRDARPEARATSCVTLFYGDGADLAEAEAMARRIGGVAAGRRDRGPARRPALLPVPDLGGVGGRWHGPRRREAPPASAPADRPGRAAATRRSRGPACAAGAQLRRAGIRLDFYTVRDLLFHLPRRYDDLREMRGIRDLYMEQDGDGRARSRRRSATCGSSPAFRGRIQRTIARLEDDTGSIDATWFGRRFIERRLPVGGEVVVSGKVKHFGRKLTLDNPEFQVADRRRPRCSTPAGSCRSTR